MKGFAGHGDLDPTRRSDPGSAFPWDYVLKKAKSLVTSPTSPVYLDRDDWADWAQSSIETMIETGLMRGVTVKDGKEFRPKQQVTREELAVVIDRLRKELK